MRKPAYFVCLFVCFFLSSIFFISMVCRSTKCIILFIWNSQMTWTMNIYRGCMRKKKTIKTCDKRNKSCRMLSHNNMQHFKGIWWCVQYLARGVACGHQGLNFIFWREQQTAFLQLPRKDKSRAIWINIIAK